ncbi:hypothetical protein ACTXT7_016729, partial [Hymenolepis weldensis]
MIVAEAPLTRRYFITNAAYTVPSFSYNRPDQLKHAHNQDLMRVLIEAMNIKIDSDNNEKEEDDIELDSGDSAQDDDDVEEEQEKFVDNDDDGEQELVDETHIQ